MYLPIWSMKLLKIKINRWTKRVCHRFLPIYRYNRYQLNQFTDFYRLTNPGPLSYVPLSLPIYSATHQPNQVLALPLLSSYQSTYLPAYLPTYLPSCLPTCLPTYLPACLPTFLPTYFPFCLTNYLPTCLSTYLSTYLPTCLPTYLPTYLPA